MKKWLGILLLSLSMLGLTSCGPDPGKYNDELMASLNSADSEYETFYSTVEKYYNDGVKNEELEALSKKTRANVKTNEERLERINALELPAEGEELKKVSIDYVKLMNETMKGFIVDKDKLTTEQFDKSAEKMGANEKLLNGLNNQIIKAQEEFAKKRGIQIIQLQGQKGQDDEE